IGHLIADRSGHALHTQLVEKILEQPDKWVLLNRCEQPVSLESQPALSASRSGQNIPLQASSTFYGPLAFQHHGPLWCGLGGRVSLFADVWWGGRALGASGRCPGGGAG